MQSNQESHSTPGHQSRPAPKPEARVSPIGTEAQWHWTALTSGEELNLYTICSCRI